MDKELRLQVYLAHCGVASRRASEALILSGRVTVNGMVVTTLGTKVHARDVVLVDGKPVFLEQKKRYIALHKPAGYICSASDPQGRPLAQDLLPPDITERVYTIGRLDYRSSGLILFTNDGDFAAALGHPSTELEKEYIVDSTVPIPDATIEAFSKGIEIDGELYTCASIERLGRKSVRIVLIEGKNREIRRVFSHFHLHPEKLHRIRIGPLMLGTLPEGKGRALSVEELRSFEPYLAAYKRRRQSHGHRD
ncbi:pseudouridine synthase [Gracilinema caldarium]|uniref:Pseudouridine synthase n=1 Tax=Gracilinema caldarium (strain ATCC 51460 / DSM 7334 / H1) TaxID=744872 RepID=F8F3E7_GRAC1|nr:pseudouridine synthase [Gracilinema caldarium]AEJ19523.1 pseudouridine synthase Rsu [Gracilinema caldarium DSM 7334]